jgi:hypothetical protein
MSQFEPSSLEDILNGKMVNSSPDTDTNKDIDQTLTPESILGEIRQKKSMENPFPTEDYEVKQLTECEPIKTERERVCEAMPEPAPELSCPNSNAPNSESRDLLLIKESVLRVEQNVKCVSDSSVKITSEVREMHKLYHNEFASRLKSMQDELERYREIDKGRVFDGILGEVAKLYTDNESVLDDIPDAKAQKRVRYLLLDIIQILESNGVFKQKSNIGDKRNTRYCQVVERIDTDNSDLHDTVALSRNTGFYIENRALIKELIDVYVYFENGNEKTQSDGDCRE